MKKIDPAKLVEAVVTAHASPGYSPELRRLADAVRSFDCRTTRVVIFGGGTGLSTVVGGNSQLDDWPDSPFTGLKQHFDNIDIIVCSTDDGGSTGRIIRDLPMIAIGDLRKLCLSMVRQDILRHTYGLRDEQIGPFVRLLHAIFGYRFPERGPDVRKVADPLLAAPRELRRHCPPELRENLARLGRYVAPGGAGPLMRPAGNCLGNLLLVSAIAEAAGGAVDQVPDNAALRAGLDVICRAIGSPAGRLHPATATPGQLVFRYANGVTVRGQAKSAQTKRGFPVSRVAIEFTGEPQVSAEVCNAIRQAELIIFAPGSLYTSSIPILQLPRIVRMIRQNRSAVKILGANFWVQEGETDISCRSRNRGFRVSEIIEAYGDNVSGGLAGLFDVVLSAELGNIPGDVLRRYSLEGKRPIYLDRERVESLGVASLEATIYSRQRLRQAHVIHHDPHKFAGSVRTILYMYRRFGRARLPGGPAAKPSRVPALPRGTVLCRYAGAIDAQIAARACRPVALRSVLRDLVWENRDIRPEHLGYFSGACIVPESRWNRSTEWDNILGYFDPQDGLLKVHEQVWDDPQRLRESLLIALGESLLGRYMESRRFIEPDGVDIWASRCYEIRLRPPAERQSYLTPSRLHTYLCLARLVACPHDRRTYRMTLNNGEGFLPPGLLFGLMYAWYLNNAYGELMEYEMSLLHWEPQRLIPHQREERARKQKLIDFFRTVIFGHRM